KCPICGMDLVPLGETSQHSHKNIESKDQKSHSKSDYNKHKGHHTSDFIKRFWVSLILTVPILLLSHMIQQWVGFSFTFPGDKYELMSLGNAIYIYGGMPFLKGMVGEIKSKAIGMMTLVALAISVAYFYSMAVALGFSGMDFFWELATLIVIMLLGHWLEMRSQMTASKALQSMVALLPNDITIERDGDRKSVV